MAIMFRYDEKKNPEGAHLPGVPLADISNEEYLAMPDWLRESLKSAPFYSYAQSGRKPAAAEEKPATAPEALSPASVAGATVDEGD